MTDPMVAQIAKRFIQRRDVKAMQTHSGAYIPVCEYNPATGRNDGPRIPWTVEDMQAHLAGEVSLGHYLVDQDDVTKLFAFDIDLEKSREPTPNEPEGWEGSWCELPDLSDLTTEITDEDYLSRVRVHRFNPREAWRDRAHPSRAWTKYQLRYVSELLSSTIAESLQMPTAVAYSGNKGVHVYGFSGPIKATEAREAAELVLALTGKFELFRGKNFYRSIDQTPFTGFPNLSIEVFPKQGSLEGKDLGNLMRLPLGRNLKSPDPAFFIDQRAPYSVMAPHPDPIALLENGRPWL